MDSFMLNDIVKNNGDLGEQQLQRNIRFIMQANNRGARSLIEKNLDELSWKVKVKVKVSHSCPTLSCNFIQINYQHT